MFPGKCKTDSCESGVYITDWYGKVWRQNEVKPAPYFINHVNEIRDIEIDNECSGGVILPQPIIIDGWHHYCDLVYTKDNSSFDLMSGYGIDSKLNVIDTVMDICRNYE